MIGQDMPTQSKPYGIVWMEFWDHCSGPADSTDVVKCQMVGILRNETKLAYYVVPWVCASNLRDINSEVYCILKSTVLKYKEIIKGESND